jgi:hypothetical protein
MSSKAGKKRKAPDVKGAEEQKGGDTVRVVTAAAVLKAGAASIVASAGDDKAELRALVSSAQTLRESAESKLEASKGGWVQAVAGAGGEDVLLGVSKSAISFSPSSIPAAAAGSGVLRVEQKMERCQRRSCSNDVASGAAPCDECDQFCCTDCIAECKGIGVGFCGKRLCWDCGMNCDLGNIRGDFGNILRCGAMLCNVCIVSTPCENDVGGCQDCFDSYVCPCRDCSPDSTDSDQSEGCY